MAAMAALALAACSYGSMVDIAPMKSRLSRPVLPPGDYCEVEGTAAPFAVVSHSDCVPVTWDKTTRTLTMHDLEDEEDNIVAAIVSLGSGLYAAQVTTPEDKIPHQIQLFIAQGAAFSVLAALDDESLKKLTPRHGKLTFANDERGRPYIAAGSVGRIKALLKDAARESLRALKEENETIDVGVRDQGGAPDHTANKQQTRDIEAVIRTAKSMTPR
jgi:hypothetical protein